MKQIAKIEPVKGGPLSKKEVDHIQAALVEIYTTHGKLTPRLFREAAKDPSSPLHKHITWDEARAALKCQLEEAAKVIRSISICWVSTDGKDARLRAWARVKVNQTEPNYQPMPQVTQARDTREEQLLDIDRRLEALQLEQATILSLSEDPRERSLFASVANAAGAYLMYRRSKYLRKRKPVRSQSGKKRMRATVS